MRVKDEIKQEALFEATIKVVNEIGFASSSVAKIAKEAGISPATIYIYHKNKEDLLVSTYVEIKKNFGLALLKNFDETLPIRDIFKQVWFNGLEYVARHRDKFHFTEQFANSPFTDLVNKAEVEKYFEPLHNILKKGIEQKIIKDVDPQVLTVFIFYPMMILSNKRVCTKFVICDDNSEQVFNMAWDAIKL